MKIKLNHSKLSKALQYTSRAVSQKPNVPILSNVLLMVDDNALKLSATNLEMGINVWIPGQADLEGTTTVSAKYIADFVAASSGENVEIELKDNLVFVQTKNSKAKFNTISSEEFPVLPKTTDKPLFVIQREEFMNSVNKVIFACSTDLSAGRIQQSGVFFDIDQKNSTVEFIGLDGFRLSKRASKVDKLLKDISKEEIIVPARYLGEAAKILSDHPEVESVEIFLSDNNSQVVVKIDDIELSIRLLEGPYPEYKKILPDEASWEFDVKKSDLEHSLKVVNSFARGNLGNKTLFDFDIETSKFVLKSEVSEIGDGETEVEVTSKKGEGDLNTAYTLRYLQDLVNHVEGDTIHFETKGALAASVYRDSEDENFMHLIMPMRRDV